MEEEKYNNNKTTILIVDDEPLCLEVIEKQLSFLGFNTLSASNGNDALKRVNSFGQIDILLTDIVMPGMNGIELISKFKKLCPKTKIILMTGYNPLSTFGISEQSRENYPCLKKPFSLEDIKVEISKTLNN